MAAVELLVGLGNPGAEYERTRHNAGFLLVEQLADQLNLRWQRESRFQGEVAKAVLNGHSFWLLKPQTFMNRSGQAVAALANYYQIAPTAILIAHDELDLAVGTVRLKAGGGHGGHNGLRDSISQLKSSEFWRLRLGIGHPGDRHQVTPYVLGRAPAAEQQLLEQAVDRAVHQLENLLAGRFDAVMNELHRSL